MDDVSTYATLPERMVHPIEQEAELGADRATGKIVLDVGS